MNQLVQKLLPVLAVFIAGAAQAQNFTVQVGSAAPPPAPLVNHGDSWRWHKGTNAPVVGWQTNADGTLGGQWLTGNGGIGYSADTAAETNNCQTILTDMRNTYSTLYFRRTFSVAGAVDPTSHLRLTMDYDDGFVAYLDGVEILRANAGGTIGTEPPNTQLAPATHESSLGTAPVNSPVVSDLGLVGSRLAVGTHVLAFIGINNTLASSDLIMVPDLAVISTNGGSVVNNGLYALTGDGTITLTGTNTVAGATRVAINGDDAAFNQGQGTWSNTVALTPGFNRLYIAALDTSGNMLSNLTQDIVYEPAPLTVTGALGANTFWTNTSQVIHITSTVTVPTNTTLTIGPGVVVILSPGASLLASAGGTIDVQGLDTREVYFLPATSSVWNEIAADGANSFLTIRHADIHRGAVKFRNGATGLLEDSYVHDYKNGTTPIAGCTSAAAVTVRRSHFSVYHETLWQITLMTVEASLFENANNTNSDALDFDTAPVGSVIRRCTFRFGPQPNTDAIDIGSSSTATLIEGCLMHDFPNDKGVSIGETSYAITIRNCLMYRNDSGVAVKDSCTAIVEGTTIANCAFGYRNYNKANPASPTGGGHITNSSNNILWDNLTTVSLLNASTVVADYSDFSGTNWPGTANISADPLFVNAAAGNYRLQAGSPALGTGAGGTNMGVTLPVGGIPMWVSNLVAVSSGPNFVALFWLETADNEDGFRVERSTDKLVWAAVGGAASNATNFTDVTGLAGVKYYYRVRATNDLGLSPVSNIASGERQFVVVVAGGNVGGTLTNDTCWAANGVFTVTSSITVPAGVTLYIKPGATVQFNSGLNLVVANGGILKAEGTSNAPIHFTRSGASGNWGSITINGAVGSPETRITYADFRFNANNTGIPCIEVNAGTAFLDHLSFGNTGAPYIHVDSASFIISDCYFPPPTVAFEPCHGTGGVKAGGHGIVQRNFFGKPIGYSDVFDFTGGNRNLGQPIVQFLGNVLVGSDDDGLDLDGTDAWVEGNIFLHFHKNGSPDSSSGVSGGNDSGNTSEVTILGNLFYDCDQAATAKQGNFFTMYNNTILHQTKVGGTDTDSGVVNFADDGIPQAAGMYLEGNIIYDIEKLVRNLTNGTTVFNSTTFTNNLMPTAWGGPGGGNSITNPFFKHIPLFSETTFTNWAQAQIMWDWLSLQTNSSGLGTGPNGTDKGAVIPAGVSLSGVPNGATAQSNATIIVGINRTGSSIPTAGFPLGSGYTHYKWRLDTNLTFSAETPTGTPISLLNLASGPHHVEVIGKNDAGFYQNDPTFGPQATITVSRTWFVGALDTDGDGMPDDWEMAHGLNKLVNDADLDPDGDGLSNVQEYLAGTDPQNPASRLWLQSLPLAGNAYEFRFTAVSNKSYTVQYRPSLSTGTWQRLQDFAPVLTNRSVVLTNVLSDPMRYYRVTTPLVP